MLIRYIHIYILLCFQIKDLRFTKYLYENKCGNHKIYTLSKLLRLLELISHSQGQREKNQIELFWICLGVPVDRKHFILIRKYSSQHRKVPVIRILDSFINYQARGVLQTKDPRPPLIGQRNIPVKVSKTSSYWLSTGDVSVVLHLQSPAPSSLPRTLPCL